MHVRLIAATNRDLTQEVKEKAFREDLYYRINVLTIHFRPCDSAKGDLPLLVEHLAGQRMATRSRRDPDPSAIQLARQRAATSKRDRSGKSSPTTIESASRICRRRLSTAPTRGRGYAAATSTSTRSRASTSSKPIGDTRQQSSHRRGRWESVAAHSIDCWRNTGSRTVVRSTPEHCQNPRITDAGVDPVVRG